MDALGPGERLSPRLVKVLIWIDDIRLLFLSCLELQLSIIKCD